MLIELTLTAIVSIVDSTIVKTCCELQILIINWGPLEFIRANIIHLGNGIAPNRFLMQLVVIKFTAAVPLSHFEFFEGID